MLNKSYDQVVALCGANVFEVMQNVFVGVVRSGLSGTIVQDCIYKLQNKQTASNYSYLPWKLECA